MGMWALSWPPRNGYNWGCLPTALFCVAGRLGSYSSDQDWSSNKDYGSKSRISTSGKGLAFSILMYRIFLALLEIWNLKDLKINSTNFDEFPINFKSAVVKCVQSIKMLGWGKKLRGKNLCVSPVTSATSFPATPPFRPLFGVGHAHVYHHNDAISRVYDLRLYI